MLNKNMKEKELSQMPEGKADGEQRYLLVVGGPTASGKTAFSIGLARHIGTEIVSCDSRQFYREMSIGTARPSEEELSEVPHHFIGHLSVTESYSVGDYERDALQRLDQLYERYRYVILTGGSGLYIKAVCEGLDDFPPVPPAIRDHLQSAYRERGIAYLQECLQEADPDYYRQVDIHNPRRLLRALAVCKASGRPYSSFLGQKKSERRFQPIYLQLDRPRPELYERINLRVDEMVARGLVEEARALYPLRHYQALQTVGYQELFDHFSGLTSLADAIELIKRNSRRYAKRQLTWFRRNGHWQLFKADDQAGAIRYLNDQMQES